MESFSTRDCKKIALEKLHGNWLLAIAVTFLASILQMGTSLGSAGSAGDSADGVSQSTDVSAVLDSVMGMVPGWALAVIASVLMMAVLWGLVSLVISGAVELGHNLFYITLCRGGDASFGILFSRFNKLFKALGLNFVMGIFIFLWSLLLIIPGIIASYRYSMAMYVMAENPDIKIMEALHASKKMMAGYKMKLFILHLSFIGWSILCLFTLGLGFIVLSPYIKAAETAFYLKVSNSNEQTVIVE